MKKVLQLYKMNILYNLGDILSKNYSGGSPNQLNKYPFNITTDFIERIYCAVTTYSFLRVIPSVNSAF